MGGCLASITDGGDYGQDGDDGDGEHGDDHGVKPQYRLPRRSRQRSERESDL
jgi:hypothetical protein